MFERSPDALLTVVEHCQRAESRLTARRLAAIAELLWHRTGEAEGHDPDDASYALITGFARTSAEVGAAMNLTPMAAAIMVGHAEALDTRLPGIAALLAAGTIDWRTTELVITRTALVAHDLIAEVDATLAERVGGWQCWSRKRIINAVDAAVRVADPAAAKERRVTADTARNLTVTALPNGMAQIRGTLTAPAAAIVDTRVAAMAAAVCPHDPRSMDNRRADALEALAKGATTIDCQCDQSDCPTRPTAPAPTSDLDDAAPDPAPAHAGSAPTGPRFVINVIASQDTVDGCSEDPGYLEGYGVIDADQIRQLAEQATLRLLNPPDVSDAAALRYQPGAALERWIRCRDLTCCFPGCDRPAWRADIDHTVPFQHARPHAGGATVPGNLKCYCRQHHRLKTFHGGPGGWREHQLPDGTVVLTSPTGRTYRNTPAGTELFADLRAPCAAPTPRRRHRRREKQLTTAQLRNALATLRPANAAQRKLNRARRQEVEDRLWRNNMRKTLLVLKGGQPSTSPWCTWVNDPPEDPWITAEWTPTPEPPQPPPDETPPF